MSAFRNAIAEGADWIELDVQRTRDGVLVVFHDETVERTTDGVGSVADLTLDEIRSLDAGDGEQVPTFEEVIQLAHESGVGLLPEAKSAHLYPGMEVEMVEAINAAGYIDETVLQCFDSETLVTAQEHSPNMQVCPLYGLWELNLSEPSPGDATIVCPMAEMVILNPWMIRQAHADGRQVFVWFGVIENPVMDRFILALGADGLMVDDPAALAKILSPE
jgi:glycerophosphoryl diester phosphodiesterase